MFSLCDATADELRNARSSATTGMTFLFVFARLKSLLLIILQDVVGYGQTRVTDARNTCPSTLETNILVQSRKLRVLMMTTDDAYKSLSIIVGQNLMSITLYLANPRFTQLPSFFTHAGTCRGLRRTGPAASNWYGCETQRRAFGNISNYITRPMSHPIQ